MATLFVIKKKIVGVFELVIQKLLMPMSISKRPVLIIYKHSFCMTHSFSALGEGLGGTSQQKYFGKTVSQEKGRRKKEMGRMREGST